MSQPLSMLELRSKILSVLSLTRKHVDDTSKFLP